MISLKRLFNCGMTEVEKYLTILAGRLNAALDDGDLRQSCSCQFIVLTTLDTSNDVGKQ